MKKSFFLGVIGESSCSATLQKIACEVGKYIAQKGCILICGGLGGVMEYACKGAKEQGGITIGILPGFTKEEANPYIDIPIVTGLNHGRNLIIVRSADALIAIGGGYGTLSEISFALKLNIPVVGIKTWFLGKEGKILKEIIEAKEPKEAVEKAIVAINYGGKN